jgi:hypothetical protein
MDNDPGVLERAALADARLGARVPEFDLGIQFVNVAGWGINTLTRCTITSTDVTYDATTEGDGTVPFVSASWLRGPNLRTLAIPIGVTITDQVPDPHARLWNNEPARQVLDEALSDDPQAPFVHAAVDNDTSLDPHRDVLVRITASSPQGSPLPDARISVHLGKNHNIQRVMNDTRLEVSFARTPDMTANFGSKFFRFRIDVAWAGGSKELPFMIRV